MMELLRQKIFSAVIETGPLPKPTGVDDASKLQDILQIVFATTGGIALLVITVAGFMYTISHGDSKIIEQAKNAILYAVIGLVVSISAYAIISFVMGRV